MTALDLGRSEHQVGPLARVVGVDRHVRRAGREHAEDRDVEVGRARRHPDADPVAAADAGGLEPARDIARPRAISSA